MSEQYTISTDHGKLLVGQGITPPIPPKSIIAIGHSFEIGVDKKFNWFQKKMIKWCFGFEVKEYENESKRSN